MASLNPWLFVASLAALATCLTHVVVGGRLLVPPLLRAELRSPVKHTHYFCWHLVTATIALMAVALAWGAFSPEGRAAAVIGAGLALAFLAVNVAQNLMQRLSFVKHPQGGFFLIVSSLALVGLAHG